MRAATCTVILAVTIICCVITTARGQHQAAPLSPYFCAGGSLEISRDACVANASKIDAMQLVDMTFALGDMEHIDNPEHLEKAKVFLLAGKHDERVNPEVVKKTQEFYEFFLPAENVKAEYEIAAGHGIPTESHGCECRESRRPLLNNCGYNTAYALLSHIYGHLEKPSSDVELKGEFIEFDQREYFDDSNVAISMSGFGAGYVPSACRDQSGCRVHMVLHACNQGRDLVGDDFNNNAGYNEVGELNNIIILYPQALPIDKFNPTGCWDWWGYTGLAYMTQEGRQITVLHKILQRVMEKERRPPSRTAVDVEVEEEERRRQFSRHVPDEL